MFVHASILSLFMLGFKIGDKPKKQWNESKKFYE